MHFDSSLILSAFLYRALSYVELKVFSEIKLDFMYHLNLIFIFRNNIFLFLKDGIFTIIEIWPHYLFQFSFCWNGFSVATVLFDNILFFAIINFIIIQKIPLRLRNDSSIMKIEIDGEEALSYGNL